MYNSVFISELSSGTWLGYFLFYIFRVLIIFRFFCILDTTPLKTLNPPTPPRPTNSSLVRPCLVVVPPVVTFVLAVHLTLIRAISFTRRESERACQSGVQATVGCSYYYVCTCWQGGVIGKKKVALFVVYIFWYKTQLNSTINIYIMQMIDKRDIDIVNNNSYYWIH